MDKFHISKDGNARKCQAKTIETCRAAKADFRAHFENKDEARKAYEKRQEESKEFFESMRKNAIAKEKVKENDRKRTIEKVEVEKAAEKIAYEYEVLNARIADVLKERKDLEKNRESITHNLGKYTDLIAKTFQHSQDLHWHHYPSVVVSATLLKKNRDSYVKAIFEESKSIKKDLRKLKAGRLAVFISEEHKIMRQNEIDVLTRRKEMIAEAYNKQEKIYRINYRKQLPPI